MNGKTKILRFILLLALLLLPASTAHAQGPGGDVFLIGNNYTLKKGETLNGNLAVIGGNISIEQDAIIKGDVVLVGGNLQLDGSARGDVVVVGGNGTINEKVDGNVVVVGGQLELTETAVVNGDITTVGGQLKRDPKAQVNGNITNNAPPVTIPNPPSAPNAPNVPNPPQVNLNVNPLWGVANTLFRALAVSAISMLLMLFFQTQFERVGDAIIRQPVMAGSFGLLTVVVAPLAIIIMVITILLIPVAAIAALLVPLAWLFGIVAIGQEVGDRFTKAINQTWAPVLTTGFGTFLIMLLGGLVGLIPCIGWLIPFLIALMGIGGVAMTWFGTRSAPGTMQMPVEVPPAT